MSRRKFEVDHRTANMTREALTCRSYGHHWDPVPPSAETQAKLLRIGQLEETVVCRRCGHDRTDIIDMDSGDVIERKNGKYPEGYLIEEPGTGRLSRGEAKRARYARLAIA